jgi:hypothetical protein
MAKTFKSNFLVLKNRLRLAQMQGFFCIFMTKVQKI